MPSKSLNNRCGSPHDCKIITYYHIESHGNVSLTILLFKTRFEVNIAIVYGSALAHNLSTIICEDAISILELTK